MNKYTFLFTLNSHKFKISVTAENEYQARLQLKEEINRKIQIIETRKGEEVIPNPKSGRDAFDDIWGKAFGGK